MQDVEKGLHGKDTIAAAGCFSVDVIPWVHHDRSRSIFANSSQAEQQVEGSSWWGRPSTHIDVTVLLSS